MSYPETSERSKAEPRRASAGQRWAEVGVLVAVFLIVGGDPAPHENEQHYLGRLKHYWAPHWCAGDHFLESPDAHLTIVWLMGWTTRLAPLGVVAWGGRLLAWGMLAWAWQRLSWTVVPTPWCSVLAAALWMVGIKDGHLAGEWVVGGVEAKCFSYVFVLLALKAFIEDRWPAVWIHLGVATALHALVGGWSGLILCGLWLRGGCQPPLRKMTPALVVAGLLGFAGVWPALAMNWSAPPDVVAEANRIYVFDRLAHHLALLSKPPVWIAERAGRHAMVLALLFLSTVTVTILRRGDKQKGAAQPEALLRVCRFAWGAAVLVMVGLAIETIGADDPLQAAKFQRYYWYRLSDVAAPMAVALAGVGMVAAGLRARRWQAAVALLALFVVVVGSFWPVVHDRLRNPAATADRRMANPVAWEAACHWVASHTPPDAVFLVPRSANSFKWRAGRAEVVTRKDIPQDAISMVEWKRRMDDVFLQRAADRGRQYVRSLSQHGAARLRELGAKYGASYVLTDQYRSVSLPVAYRNDVYIVYSLPADNHWPTSERAASPVGPAR